MRPSRSRKHLRDTIDAVRLCLGLEPLYRPLKCKVYGDDVTLGWVFVPLWKQGKAWRPDDMAGSTGHRGNAAAPRVRR